MWAGVYEFGRHEKGMFPPVVYVRVFQRNIDAQINYKLQCKQANARRRPDDSSPRRVGLQIYYHFCCARKPVYSLIVDDGVCNVSHRVVDFAFVTSRILFAEPSQNLDSA